MIYDHRVLFVPTIVIGLLCACQGVGAAGNAPTSDSSQPASAAKPPGIASASPASTPEPKKHHKWPKVGPTGGMVTEIDPQSSHQVADTMAAAATASNNVSRKADRSLGRTVRKALSTSKGIDVSNVFVRARGGAVTLQGTVPDEDQVSKAGAVAAGISGVTSVENKIGIRSEGH